MKRTGYSGAITRRLLRLYSRSTDTDRAQGATWYADARSQAESLADRYGITVAQAVGVIAAISPGLRWEINVRDAESLIRAWRAKRRVLPIVGTYGRRNRDKAVRILNGESPLDVLSGYKVRSFYQNILDGQCSDVVTVDRHAKRIAYGLPNVEDGTQVVRPSEYDYIARHYRRAAQKIGICARDLQATLWVAWHRLSAANNVTA